MWTLILAALWLGCASDAPSAEPAAAVPAPAALPAADPTEPTPAELARELKLLDDRLARVELLLAELKTEGIIPAEHVSYDPRKTTLDARNIQDVVDELAEEVGALSKNASPSMGQPGPGLFALPPDNDQQPPGGQPGPPQGGGQPLPPNNGSPPQGGGRGPGQPSGGRPPGGSGPR